MGKALFAEEPDSGYRLLTALLVAALLIFVDTRSAWLQPARTGLSFVVEPMISVVDWPRRAAVGLGELFATRHVLAEDNARLLQENLVLQRHVQRLASISAENARLRELLNSSALLDSTVLVAEIVAFDPDPSRQEAVIDMGASAGLYVGQPVLDSRGIMGQLIAVGRSQSRVIFITDSRHGIPVEVNRNGVRSIAAGTTTPGLLKLRYLSTTADVRVGDLLVSSGLGGIFPRGYPVARVSRVVRDPGEMFIRVEARPAAALERSRQVLLVFAQQQLQATLLLQAEAETMPATTAVPAPALSAPVPAASGEGH